MSATLADIRLSFRKLTAQYQTTQIADAQIDAYVNTYYLYDLPEQLRLLKLKTNWTFTTTPYVEYVNIDTTQYINVEPPLYVNGYRAGYFQSQEEFYGLWPEYNEQVEFNIGNGGAGPYTMTLVSAPVIAGRINSAGGVEPTNVIVSAQTAAGVTLVATDDGAGGFNGNAVAGAINYVTGAITGFTFSAAIPNGATITVTSIPYQPSRPTSALLYRDQIMLRPIPDKVYKCTIEAFIFPTALAAAGSEPELRQWWQLLAYGAAYKYFAEFKDTDNLQYVKVLLDEQLQLAERRTIKQLSNQRNMTIYNVRSLSNSANRYAIPTWGGNA